MLQESDLDKLMGPTAKLVRFNRLKNTSYNASFQYPLLLLQN